MGNFVGISLHHLTVRLIAWCRVATWETLLSGDILIEVLHNAAFSSHGLV